MMNNVIPSKINLKVILDNLLPFVDTVYKHLLENTDIFDESSNKKEIAFSVYYFIFIKLTEYDFRHNKIGSSVGSLQIKLEQI